MCPSIQRAIVYLPSLDAAPPPREKHETLAKAGHGPFTGTLALLSDGFAMSLPSFGLRLGYVRKEWY